MSFGLGFGFPRNRPFAGGPSLNFQFDGSTTLDPQITFTRASTATYFDSAGVLQSAANNVPRLDYNPATLAARGLLIEEQRTNFLTYSEAFDTAPDWAVTRASVTPDAAVSPDGTVTADELIEDTTATNTHYISQFVSFTTGTNYTVSVFAKATASPRFLQIVFPSGAFGTTRRPYFDLVNGTTVAATDTTSTITPVGNGWYRCTATMLSTATASASILYQLSATATTSNPTYTGDGTSGLFLWGAQLEAGAFPTSYIPTTTTSLTRSADVASVTTLSPWFNAAQGTVFVSATLQNPPATAISGFYALSNGTNSERIYVNTGTGAGGNINAVVTAVGVLQAQTINGGLSTAGTYNYANVYKVDDFASVVNGGAAVTDSLGSLPTVDRLILGANPVGNAAFLNGYLRRITYYPRKLSSAELQAITA